MMLNDFFEMNEVEKHERLKNMENLICIGDNLEIMKSDILNDYKHKIKFIYIDPPYNTLTKKSYNDKTDSNDWEKFMYDRIYQSKQFLTKDGVIFISIDDNEYATLKIICDNIFKKENFVGTFITKQSQRSNAKHINTIHEYILCYTNNKKILQPFKISRLEIPEDRDLILNLSKDIKNLFNLYGREQAEKELRNKIKKICLDYNITWIKNYSNVDENGKIFFAVDLSTPSNPREVHIEEINLHLPSLKTRGWTTDERFIELHNNNRLVFKSGRPYCKLYLEESTNNCPSCLNFFSRQGTKELKKLGLDGIFDTPKPTELIKFLIRISTQKDDIVMDYFAGSGTTAQAVYELNEEDDRNNSYILIQLDEKINEDTECYRKCKELGIKPSVDEVLFFRINRFLENNNKQSDYRVEYLERK